MYLQELRKIIPMAPTDQSSAVKVGSSSEDVTSTTINDRLLPRQETESKDGATAPPGLVTASPQLLDTSLKGPNSVKIHSATTQPPPAWTLQQVVAFHAASSSAVVISETDKVPTVRLPPHAPAANILPQTEAQKAAVERNRKTLYSKYRFKDKSPLREYIVKKTKVEKPLYVLAEVIYLSFSISIRVSLSL